MEGSEWFEVLKPRKAVIAGLVGLAIVYPCVYYASYTGYVLWGYSPPQWKGVGLAVDVLAFTLPYLLVKWVIERR